VQNKLFLQERKFFAIVILFTSIMVVGGIKSLPSLRWIAKFVGTYGHTGNEITR
jgi:hypothetical protein